MLGEEDHKETDNSSCGQGDVCDPFSKLTLTLDVDLSARHAISDLDGWLAKADSGLVDDLEKLPYVSAAMQQLKQRKKYWNELRASNSEKASNLIDNALQVPSISANAVDTDDENCSNGSRTSSTDFPDQSKVVILDKSTAGGCQDETLDPEKKLIEQEMNLSSSYEEKKCIQGHSKALQTQRKMTLTILSERFLNRQNEMLAADGQHLILHPLNTKCLLHHYGSYDKLPHRISGRILQLETVTQSEAMRRRYRFLSHFPLTTTFQLCEVDLSEMLPAEALAPFLDEIKNRANQRKQLAKKELKEKLKAEATSNYALSMSTHYQFISRDDPPTFSMDDFEALGNSALSSSPPVVGERKLFSSVTRLGFAAAHDSPSFQAQETSNLHNNNSIADSSGLRNGEILSYSNVISKAESNGSSNAPKTNDTGKKGKKPNRVLLSTAGGRRY
ncbi:unnamed protein product [Vicia faba]|uniref:Uncharacterized protein n=1 Tax=Vicia faba TaxID=3906 RepID=A0AAV1ASL3_VICFA|nr:unnamed protein product [Vicia faba]